MLGGDPAHATQLARYAHVLRQRAKLLRGGRFDPSWLGGLERQAAAAGVAIAAARRQSVRGLSAARVDPPDGFRDPDLALAGQIEDWLAELPALEVEERFAEALAAIQAAGCRDRQHRDRTASQRSRWCAIGASGRLAGDCSTGQQKALLSSLVLAEARLRAAAGERQPILLLDEVAAHLDGERRAALFEALARLGAQAWLTGTDAATFAPLGAARPVLPRPEFDLAAP